MAKKTIDLTFGLTHEDWKKWGLNLIKFSLPALAILFAQLATGVPVKQAGMIALLALYGLIADYLKKKSERAK